MKCFFKSIVRLLSLRTRSLEIIHKTLDQIHWAWMCSHLIANVLEKLIISNTVFKPNNKIQIWCGFDRASSLTCGNRMPARCNRGFYCGTYCLLNMFRAPLCPSSGAQEYCTVVAACGIWCS